MTNALTQPEPQSANTPARKNYREKRDRCSPSILSVDPTVGNPVGHVVEIGFAQRHAIAEFSLVRPKLVAGPPEVELQRFVHELPPAARCVAGVVGRRIVRPLVRVREAADVHREEVDTRVHIDPSCYAPNAAIDPAVAHWNRLL